MAIIGKSSKEARNKAAERIIRRTQSPPRKLYMNGYTQAEIAAKMAPGGTMYGGKEAQMFLAQAPKDSRPGFYKDGRKNNYIDQEPSEVAPPVEVSEEEKEQLTLNVIELMTENNKLSKTKALEQLDELAPEHGLEAENKAVVIAALTKVQLEAAE